MRLRWLFCGALAFTACATTPEQPSGAVESSEDAELNRLLAELEKERMEEERHRESRTRELLPLLEPVGKALDPDAWRSRAVDLGELSRLSYEGGELERAIVAVGLAVEAAISAGEESLTNGLNDFRVLVHKFVALELAKQQKFAEAERVLARLETAPGLDNAHKGDVSSLKKVVFEMQGADSDQARTDKARAAAVEILRSEATKPKTPGTRSDAAERFDLGSDAFRGALSERLGTATAVSEAELPAVGDAPATETGTLDQKTVQTVVTANRASIRACYNRAIKSGAIRGKLEVEATVQPTGVVSEAEILTASFQKTAVAECIQEVILRWRFPPFEGEEAKTVALPFVLDAY